MLLAVLLQILPVYLKKLLLKLTEESINSRKNRMILEQNTLIIWDMKSSGLPMMKS